MKLLDCLAITLADSAVTKSGTIYRTSDDLSEKLAEHKREEIKIGAKVFLNSFSPNHLTAAIDNLLEILNISRLDNLILAYHPGKAAAVPHVGRESNASTLSSVTSDNYAAELKELWTILEQFAHHKKIVQLGIADLDTATLEQLYKGSSVFPSIVQINLSACCVVPPALQEFCNEHEIQLLTHSDPEGI